MDIKSRVRLGQLLSIYGGLLTDTQRYIFSQYIDLDVSLSEIAENLSITRQGVRESIVTVTNKLNEYEQKLNVSKMMNDVIAMCRELSNEIDDNNVTAKQTVDSIIKLLEE